MLEIHLARQRLNQSGYADPRQRIELLEQAQHLYHRSALRGWAGRIWGKLSGRSRALLDLKAVLAGHRLAGYHSGGTRVVPLEQIRGSVDRTHDFDQNFNPLQSHTERRWVDLAVAWLTDVTLPPVKLIRVGELYFVEDGHHRVSVARALEQRFIDAEITVWEVRPKQSCHLAPCFCGAAG